MPQPIHYDAIVIGSSQGGRFLPAALAQAGRKVALIERDHLGGTCVNNGCMPTKTLVASARVAHLARRAAEFGVRLQGTIEIDALAVRARAMTVVEGAGDGLSRGVSGTPDILFRRGSAATRLL